MRNVHLGSIAESLPCDYGDEPTNDALAFSVVKVSNVSGEGQFHGDFEKRQFRDNQLANLLVKEGELLVVKSSGSKANILSGKTAICGVDRAGKIVASNFLLRLRVDESAAIPRFLWYVLNSGASKAFVKTIVGASTYPNLKWSSYAAHPIPLPPLSEQRRIAEVLDRVEALRAKRRAALAQLDSLTQAIFIEMFGDPIKNPSKLPVKKLIELVDPERPISYGILMPGPEQEVGVSYVRVVDMKNGGIELSGVRKTTPAMSNQFKRSLLKPGDLLMSIRGHVGRLATVPPELDQANITQDTARMASAAGHRGMRGVATISEGLPVVFLFSNKLHSFSI